MPRTVTLTPHEAEHLGQMRRHLGSRYLCSVLGYEPGTIRRLERGLPVFRSTAAVTWQYLETNPPNARLSAEQRAEHSEET